MPPRRNAGPPPNIAPIIVGVGFLGMGVAFYFGFPGVGVMLLALMFAGWSSVPPIFTGKKDSQGRPTAIDDGEKRMMNSYRFWSDLKWRLLIPNGYWLPGMNAQRPQRAIEHFWTPNLVWIIASALGILALGIPTRGPVELLGGAAGSEVLFRLIDGFALFSIIVVTTTAARANFTPDDPRPGITLKHAMSYLGTPKGLPLFFAGGIMSGIAAMAVFVYGGTFDLGKYIAPLPIPVVAVAVFFLLYALVLFLGSRNDALEHWRLVASKRPEWEQRWAPVLKTSDEAPRLVDFEQVGFFEVSTFDASASMGYGGVLAMESKIAPALGAGRMATILSSPDIDSSGQPMPGTVNPRRFRVVTYPSDELVDFTDVNADPKVIEIGAEVAMMRVIVANGLGRPVFMDVSPAFTIPDPIEPDEEELVEDTDGDGTPDAPATKRKWWQRRPSVEETPDEQPTYTGAWLAHWAVPNGPPFSFLADYAQDIGAEAGTDVTIDKRNGDIFFGDLYADTTPWTNPANAKRVKNIDLDNVWYRRWKNVFQGKIEFIPRREADLYGEAKIGDITIYRQPFSMGQGVELKQYDRLEDKLAVALDSAPMVAITGFKSQGDREGARHPQGMCVVWSPSAQVPSSPERLKPGSRANANEWVLTWMLNRAFDHTKRLARPEIISTKCLTSTDSSGHIWEMKLRLYGGVTLEEVRTQSERIRQSMAASWIRVIEDAYGCTIAVGVKPNAPGVKLSNPRTADRIAELNWEQAFAISGVSGHGGVLPKMVNRSVMEKNKNVSVLDFTLPAGCEIENVKKVIGKLSPATDNAFLQINPTDDPKVIRILAAERNPLEKSYAPDWDEIDESDGIPFATGVDGASMVFSPKKTPHCLVSGLSGGGKFQPLSSKIPVPVSDRFPYGWALLGDLREGDSVFSPCGEIVEVTGLHLIQKRRLYEVTLSDGQVIRASEGHLWKVSSVASRMAHGQAAIRVRAERGVFESAAIRAERVAHIRELAASTPQGQVASYSDIAGIAGIDPTRFYQMVPTALAVDTITSWNRTERVFDGAELAGLWKEGEKIGGRPIEQHAIDALASSAPLSIATATAILVERVPSRNERSRMKDRIRKNSIMSCGTGRATKVLPMYPVDEALTFIADRMESSVAEVMPLETVVSTEDMMETLRYGQVERVNWAIRLADPIEGEDIDLTVPGYTLGAWLGDGSAKGGEVTSMDEDIIREIEMDGYVVRRTETQATNRASTYFFDNLFADLQAILDLSTTLKTRGSLDKRIPARYLRASVETRLAVLQGLMDTDGTINKTGSCELGLSKHDLALDALELIRSLGIKASIAEKQPTYMHSGVKKTGATHYRIKFTTTLPVFRLPRKAERLPATLRDTSQWLYVENIREVEPELGRCISVSGEQHMYLTDGFVPTHNSVLVQTLVFGALVRDWDLAVIDPVKGGADFKFAEDYIRAMAIEKDDFFAAAGLMKMIYAEVARRVRMNSKHGVASFADLPEDIRPNRILLIIDEFTSAIEQEKVPPRSDDAELEAERDAIIALNNAKLFIAQFTGKILREARSAGVTVILATQKLSAKSLDAVPGGETMKMQLSRILLGNATFADKMSALRKPEASPDLGTEVPPGRGIYEPSDGGPQIIQAWYSSTHVFREKLEERSEPIGDEGKWDYSGFIARPEDGAAEDELQIPDAFDSFGDDFQFTGFADEEPGEVGAEFVAGIVGDEVAFSLDAIIDGEFEATGSMTGDGFAADDEIDEPFVPETVEEPAAAPAGTEPVMFGDDAFDAPFEPDSESADEPATDEEPEDDGLNGESMEDYIARITGKSDVLTPEMIPSGEPNHDDMSERIAAIIAADAASRVFEEPVVALPESPLPVVVEEDDSNVVIEAANPERDGAPLGVRGAVFITDVDGVLAPFSPTANTTDREVSGMGIVHLDAASARRISLLPVTPVFVTDWERELVESVFTPLFKRAVGYAPNEGSTEYWWKIETIMRLIDDNPEITSVIWVDDLMGKDTEGGVRREQLLELMDIVDIPALAVETDSNVGLTESDWSRIEGFLGLARDIAETEVGTEDAIDLSDVVFDDQPVEEDEADEIDFSQVVALPAPPPVESDDPFADIAPPRVVEGRIGNTGHVEGGDAQ